jgi:prepilin-type N-terminal cleavage/methylation domain-containing protein
MTGMKREGREGAMKLRRKQRGFSLIELMVSVLILMVVMGAVLQQVDRAQKQARSEEVKLDMFQTAREFIDQMTRDLHQAGFPNRKLFNSDTMDQTAVENAVGIFYIAQDEIRIQGDVDGDGNVDFVAYKLFPKTADPKDQNCPCLRRSQLLKAPGDPMSQVPDWKTQVENVSILGNNGGRIFRAYDKYGNEVLLDTPQTKVDFNPLSVTDPVNKIFSVQILLNVQAATSDIGSTTRPVAFLTATAQVTN